MHERPQRIWDRIKLSPQGRKRTLWALSFLCLLGAAWYFPLFYPFIKNDITATPLPVDARTNLLQLPYILTKPDANETAVVYIHLVTDTDYVVGRLLYLTVTAYLPTSVTRNIDLFYAIPDAAVPYPVEGASSDALPPPSPIVEMRIDSSNPTLTKWTGFSTVQYTVWGTFGLNLAFLKNMSNGNATLPILIALVHTDPLFSINAQDAWTLKTSQSLNMTLTFLLLFFVVLEFVRADHQKENA